MNNKEKKKPASIFVEGPVSPEFIAGEIAKHSTKTNIGAHQIFLGQIRNDIKNSREVRAIEFSAYPEMVHDVYLEIREQIFAKYALTCMHVYHSLGKINAGEINLFVFVSSEHRRDATMACMEMVELIKSKLPIWGKECYDDQNHTWKENR